MLFYKSEIINILMKMIRILKTIIIVIIEIKRKMIIILIRINKILIDNKLSYKLKKNF